MTGLAWFKGRPKWSAGATALTTRWLESTLEVARWESMRRAGRRWGAWGVALGLLLGSVACAPAGWLAWVLSDASHDHVLLADARGTVWRGDAVLVLSAGSGSRDATVLPGRLAWTLSLGWSGVHLAVLEDCCMQQAMQVTVRPGWGGMRVQLQSQAAAAGEGELGHWPAALLGGWGTPWNTLQLGGQIRASTPGLSLQWTQGRMQVQGSAQVNFSHLASSLTPLSEMGSYELDVQGDAQGQLQVSLRTLEGMLELTGEGAMTATGMRFRGQAQSSDPTSPALDNVLNIIGRRDGVRSAISIG